MRRGLWLLCALLVAAFARAQTPIALTWQPVALAQGCTAVYYTLYHAPNVKGPYAEVTQGDASLLAYTFTGSLYKENFWMLVATCAPSPNSTTLAGVAWKFP